ncbi:MAG: DegT/DnrJ/EryC1/StrS family aminotransferase [Thermoplasmatales archaeon]|nr:MAG: DegT/DnrJ/EryC1/StrS family aminotransferase [Thermoplasmatales archaeon]
MNWKIPLFKIYWEKDDIESVTKIISRGSYWTAGPEIEQLENEIAKFVGAKYSLLFNSGTSALHSVLSAHDIVNGEVIIPSFTFISTANSVVLSNNKPIFAEIEEESYGLELENVKEKINRRTKAIIPVHYGGAPCKRIKALKEIAEDYNILLIEDAAESLGAKINNEMVGNFGHSSMFSFCQNKVITGGEGGVIVTDSKEIHRKLKLICSHGRVENKNGFFSTTKELDYIQAGYNYRMSSITASLILSQLKKIDKIIELRRRKADYYNKKLSKLKFVKIPVELKNCYNVYQMYTIQTGNNKIRRKLQEDLSRAGIMTKVYFEPIHIKTFYRNRFNYKEGDLPITEEISRKVLTLPLYPTLSYKEIDYVFDIIKNSCG